MYSVYALVDPRNESIHYIGMSKNAWRRYAMHLLIPSKATPAKNAWVEELRKLDLSPLLTILEVVETEEETREREVHWIQHYLDLNVPLVNVAKTGKTSMRKVDLSLVVEAFPPSAEMLETLITPQQIAEESGISEFTVKRLLRSGELRGLKVGSKWRIRPSDVQDYLNKQAKQDKK